MTRTCCVPQCGNRYVVGSNNLKFHRFPGNNNRKQWKSLLKIQKEPTNRMVVCSDHFKENDYIVTSLEQFKILKQGSIPSLKLPKPNIGHLDGTKAEQTDSEILRRPLRTYGPCHASNRFKSLKSSNQQDVTTHKPISVFQSMETEIPNRLISLNSFDQQYVPIHEPISVWQATEIPIIKTFASISTQTNEEYVTRNKYSCNRNLVHQSTQTVAVSNGITISNLKDKDIEYLTGLDKTRFKVILRMLEEFDPLSDSTHISKEDKLFILLLKYRHNLDFKMIATISPFNRLVISDAFKEVTVKLYHILKQIDIWNISSENPMLYVTIVDSTEFPVERAKNPVMHQQTFSQYKNRPTFKNMVGCDEMGGVNFISYSFSGGISDREIFIKSEIIDKLKPGQAVTADKGFEISDLLEEKGVLLNIPPFLRNRVQFDEIDVLKTRTIANRRIIIEQLNGRAKKNRILVDIMPTALWPYANKIFFNCFSLLNFYKPIK